MTIQKLTIKPGSTRRATHLCVVFKFDPHSLEWLALVQSPQGTHTIASFPTRDQAEAQAQRLSASWGDSPIYEIEVTQ